MGDQPGTAPHSGVFPRGDQDRLVPAGSGQARITGGCWARRQHLNRVVSEPAGFESLIHTGTLNNFLLAAAGGPAGQRRREYFAASDGGDGAGEAGLAPYYAWGNRHPGQTMRVWIPTT